MDTTTHGKQSPPVGLPRPPRSARRATSRGRRSAAVGLLLLLGPAGCGAPGESPTGADDASADSRTETAAGDGASAGEAGAGSSGDGSPSGVGDIDVDSFTVEAKQSRQFPGSVDPVEEGDELLLHTVRVGSREGFDRVVFEHSGAGMPAWRVEYVERPTQPGSGGTVDMPGRAFIAVHAQGLRPGNAGEGSGHRVGARDWSPASTVIRSTYSTVVFEGSSTYYIGLDRERPFEVRALEDPTRLVVDVAS